MYLKEKRNAGASIETRNGMSWTLLYMRQVSSYFQTKASEEYDVSDFVFLPIPVLFGGWDWVSVRGTRSEER